MRALASRAKTQLAQLPDVQMKTNIEPELSAGVIKFRLRSVPTQRAYDNLWQKNRLAIAMTASGDAEGLRLSPPYLQLLRGYRPGRSRCQEHLTRSLEQEHYPRAANVSTLTLK